MDNEDEDELPGIFPVKIMVEYVAEGTLKQREYWSLVEELNKVGRKKANIKIMFQAPIVYPVMYDAELVGAWVSAPGMLHCDRINVI